MIGMPNSLWRNATSPGNATLGDGAYEGFLMSTNRIPSSLQTRGATITGGRSLKRVDAAGVERTRVPGMDEAPRGSVEWNESSTAGVEVSGSSAVMPTRALVGVTFPVVSGPRAIIWVSQLKVPEVVPGHTLALV